MKVESIRIKNFKAISDENIQINGNNVYVLGPNGTGKSSFLDAIFKIISGKDLPSKVTKEGAKNGVVEIDLGEVIVKATFNEKNEKVSLSLESKEGAVYKAPRSLLDQYAGVVDFDINRFFNMKPKEQVDFIKQLVGIDFTDLDDEYKRLYDERTIMNRRVKELEPLLKIIHKDKIEPKPLSEMQKKIQEATEKNSKIKDVRKREEERKKEILELQLKLDNLKDLSHKATEWLKLKENQEADITDLQKEFDEAIKFNKEVEDNLKNIENKAKFDKAEADQKALNEKLQEIEETKKRVISESKMPVPGLSFDDNQLFYNGLPFEKSQINTAQQIIVGLQINLALLKDIKIARFDGSLLDNKNIKEVEKWAKKNGLQLFVEFVDRSAEGLKIEIKEENEQLQEA